MNQLNGEEIAKKHFRWLKEMRGWKPEDQAAFFWTDFSGVDLSGKNLTMSCFSECSFVGCKLTGTNFSSANIDRCVFTGCDLTDCSFAGARISGTNFSLAVIKNGVFANALIEDTVFEGADLTDAKLYDARIDEDALLKASGVEVCIRQIPHRCPDKDAFICYKKVRDNLIIKLEVPDDAKRINIDKTRCKASKVIVLEFQNINGTKSKKTEVASLHNPNFIYHPGDEIEIKSFRNDASATSGIYFFMERDNAVKY